MTIKRVDVRNFRLLRDISLLLEPKATVIVGRNNSGKTSLTELFRRLLVDQAPNFRLDDISLASHQDFWTAARLLKEGRPLDEIRKVLPVIEVRITISYEADLTDVGALGACIIDVDPNCCDALIVVCFAPADGRVNELLASPEQATEDESQRKENFFRARSDRIGSAYAITVHAEDPNDSGNRKALDIAHLRAVIRGDLITAQRGLDDTTSRDSDTLGKLLQVLFDAALSDTTETNDKTTAEQLKLAVDEIQRNLQQNVTQHVAGLLPTFDLFGYPGFADPRFVTETIFDVQRLLKSHTRIRYAGVHGINLPET